MAGLTRQSLELHQVADAEERCAYPTEPHLYFICRESDCGVECEANAPRTPNRGVRQRSFRCRPASRWHATSPHSRRSYVETELQPCTKTERADQKGPAAGKAATAVGSTERSRRARTRDPRGRIRRFERPGFRARRLKLTSLSGPAARQGRTDRLRRDRAAALALRTVFPAVRQLRLEFTFEGTSANTPASQSHLLHPPAQAFFTFPCPYFDCDGQFDLTGAMNAALQAQVHEAEGLLECPGVRARDYASKQPCGLHLIYKFTASY